MSTFTNSEEPDEMSHNVAFHQGLHCLERSKRSSNIKYIFLKTSSPMGNDSSFGSQHNDWRHHYLRCSKAGNSELETVIRNNSNKILGQFWLISASIKKI